MREDFETGFFIDDNGHEHIKNEFDPDRPVYIMVEKDKWICVANGQKYHCDWSVVNRFPDLSKTLKEISVEKLSNSNSPSYLPKIHHLLRHLLAAGERVGIDFNVDFGSVSAATWFKFWDLVPQSHRSTFRSYYQYMALEEAHGAKYEVALEMASWKARNDLVHLNDVLMWDPTKGALTSLEWEQVRRYLESYIPCESLQDYSIRLFCRMMMETLKRPSQILKIKRDGLIEIESKDGTPSEFFLKISRGKGQTGGKPKAWPITEKLGKDIRAYSQNPDIRIRQEMHDLLFILPRSNPGNDSKWQDYGRISSPLIRSAINRNFKVKSGLVSHRTNEVINMSPYRIRHTGATALALQGFSRQEIQDVLEHDSPSSADAYINAVGSDLFPAIENATDRGLGRIFGILSESYFFKGCISEKIGESPIIIPSLDITDKNNNAPALVGSCSKDGICNKHPFWACYNGCEYFMAWKNFDHSKSLNYLEIEFNRWSAAEGGKQRSRLSKDFDKVAASIREVIREIDKEN